MTKAMKRTYDGLACKLRSGWRGVMWLEVQTRRGEERKRPDTAATLMSRRFMSCWSAERKPWLILGKTIWAGVCEVKRCRRLKEDQVPEEGGGRQAGRGGREEGKCKRETDFVRKCSRTLPPPTRTSTFSQGMEKSTLFFRGLARSPRDWMCACAKKVSWLCDAAS